MSAVAQSSGHDMWRVGRGFGGRFMNILTTFTLGSERGVTISLRPKLCHPHGSEAFDTLNMAAFKSNNTHPLKTLLSPDSVDLK